MITVLSQLSPDLTKNVGGKGSVGDSTATSNEAFNIIQSVEFGGKSFLVELRN